MLQAVEALVLVTSRLAVMCIYLRIVVGKSLMYFNPQTDPHNPFVIPKPPTSPKVAHFQDSSVDFICYNKGQRLEG